MRSTIICLASLLLCCGQGWAIGIQDLLDAAARQPGYEISALGLEEASLQQERATAGLLPKLGLFGRYERYSSPTNLRPMPPTEINVQAGDSIPFSREILRYGLNIDVPVFVYELYVTRQKARILTSKAETLRQLDVIGRQASVVALNSALEYFRGLGEAISARRTSLGKTLEDMTLKVRIGRSPESELLKIKKTINDLDQQRNELEVKRLDTLRELKSLTGIDLAEPVAMTLVASPGGDAFLPLEAAQYEAEAALKEVARRQAARYPTLSVTGFVSGNDGEAYNTGDDIERQYSAAALVVKFPLFDASLDTEEAIARVQSRKANAQVAQTKIDMTALAETLDRKIATFDDSIELARKSIAESQTLLDIAQVSVRVGRMTTEYYLRFESDVLAAQASLHQAQQQRWQALTQKAALFGTDLRGVVR
jgi:outer membrane protein TolC